MKYLKSLILTLGLVLGLTTQTNALSGHFDLSKIQTGKVGVLIAGTIVDVDAEGNWTTAKEAATITRKSVSQKAPTLTWVTLGRVAKLGTSSSSNYLVDAYNVRGEIIGTSIPFKGNLVTIPGNYTGGVYLKLHETSNTNKVAFRSLIDSAKIDTTAKIAYYIVISDSGKIDTLKEVKINDWNSILPTSYIVQRNVDVTIPAKYDKSTVKIGYYNIYTNPSNYYSVELGRYTKSKYSGFIYSAYDSASYAGNNYLYSALAIIKDKNDSVVAFSQDLDTVTAKVGNFSFDSSRFVNGIVNVRKDTLITPWYAFDVKNGTSVTTYHSVLKTLDSVITDTSYAINAENVGGSWLFSDTVSAITWGRFLGGDTNKVRVKFAYEKENIRSKYELDTVSLTFVSSDTNRRVAHFSFPCTYVTEGGIIKSYANFYDTLSSDSGTYTLKYKATANWITPSNTNSNCLKFEIGSKLVKFTEVKFKYKKTTYFYK